MVSCYPPGSSLYSPTGGLAQLGPSHGILGISMDFQRYFDTVQDRHKYQKTSQNDGKKLCRDTDKTWSVDKRLI